MRIDLNIQLTFKKFIFINPHFHFNSTFSSNHFFKISLKNIYLNISINGISLLMIMFVFIIFLNLIFFKKI